MAKLKEFDLINLEDDESDSGSEGSGSSGFNEPIIDMALFGFAQAGIREGERRFGAIPDPKDPYVQGDEMEMGQSLLSHPLLGNAAEFNGVDRSMNSNPKKNRDAERNYHQLQHRLALQAAPKLGKSNVPRLTIGPGRS